MAYYTTSNITRRTTVHASNITRLLLQYYSTCNLTWALGAITAENFTEITAGAGRVQDLELELLVLADHKDGPARQRHP